jgi:hypothetical protein
MLPGAFARPPLGIAVGGEGEPFAIRRPSRPEEAAGLLWIALDPGLPRQIAKLLRLEIENPDVRLVGFAG